MLVHLGKTCYNVAVNIIYNTKEEVMDKQVEAGSETLAGIQTFVARYPFPLDAFQLEAIAELARGQSVMVAAPTGTGKTLVAEFAIWLAQQRNQRVIYTTPLKALSNQKYRDLREIYGYDTVGLVTGDIVQHSRASGVVMTTEVDRNMLLEEGGERFTSEENPIPSSLADVGFVIFDELHYLSDIGRGPVWEEAIICSPPHVQLVGLSATVSNAEDLANWFSRVHRPISLIVHEQRAVPLEHYDFLDNKLHLVQDATVECVEREADLLPCLYFLPGRRVVEEAAMSAALHLFTTPEEQELIKEEVGIWLEQLPKEDRSLQQVYALAELLPRGLAFHHAGLLPGLKVLVETLFARGHLRAVFATDTLALGVNMPARSVVVGSLSKFDGQEMRLLTPNEYRQLTGRAGRRGMDVHGAAIIPYSPWEPFESSFERITDELLPVTSSFIIRYNSVLNLWRPGDIQHLRRICASSLREFQRYLLWEINELQRLEKRYQKARKSGKKSKKRAKAIEGAAQALERRRKSIGAYPLSRAGAAELDGTIFALRALGYIGQNDRLTIKGRLLRSIFHPSGVLMVELMMLGALDELSAGELAEVCSWFTFDNDRRLNNRDVLSTKLKRGRTELWHIHQQVHGIEERANINFTHGIVPDFHGIALAWARGTTLTGLLRRIDLAEGDLLMVLNQTIDLLQQVQAAVGHVLDARDIWEQASPVLTDVVVDERASAGRTRNRAEQLRTQREHMERLRPMLAQASSSLLRGIIIQSRTTPSMAAQVGGEELPLDAEEDLDPQDIDPRK